MITVRPDNSITYNRLKNARKSVVFYPHFFTNEKIDAFINDINGNEYKQAITTMEKELTTLTHISYKSGCKTAGGMAYISLGTEQIIATRLDKKIIIPCVKGSVVILGDSFRLKWEVLLPELGIKLYDYQYTPKVYLSIPDRIENAKKLRELLKPIHELPIWKQCIQRCLNLDIVGKGSYGNVFKSSINCRPFAVKITKLKPEAVKHPYNTSVNSWHEVYFLKNIIRPLLQRKVCPNLPLLIDDFVCDDCRITIENENINSPCVITIVELANGDLKSYLSVKRTDEEIYSALFQIMAALHTIQMNGQIMNFDVKKENILYYDVVSGGYWKYRIHSRDYYVPNCGKLFILNDFGISRPMSPLYPIFKNGLFRLGSRYAMVHKDKFVPLNASSKDRLTSVEWLSGSKSSGVEFVMRENGMIPKVDLSLPEETVMYLRDVGIPLDSTKEEFYNHPEIIPPFEFYNDTQDAIRMFVGGKRTTQKGNHRFYTTISKKIVSELKEYVGKGAGMKDDIFSDQPSQVLAGYFIESFFGKFLEYTTMPKGKDRIIETYVIS